MKIKLLNKNFVVVNGYTPEYVLADWQQAITTFYDCYQQVLTCISQIERKQALSRTTNTHMGQCPVAQLVQLTTTMQDALMKLL